MRLVDIVMPTYRHERFVAEAIESVLAQKTTFEYRLLIGDDGSPDGTPAIIKSFADRNPHRIEASLFANHVGIQSEERVAVGLLRRATSKYVTILEGDDFWTDPYRLQRLTESWRATPNALSASMTPSCFMTTPRSHGGCSRRTRKRYQPSKTS